MQKVRSSDESLRVERSTKLEPKPPNHIDYGARVVRNLGPVQVHHIFPFHYCVALGRPDLELDERNLITLCGNSHDGIGENRHLCIGHLDNFQSSNLSVVRDARKTFFGAETDDIKNDKRWQRRRRLEPLELMDEEERAALVALMDRRMPNAELPPPGLHVPLRHEK